MHVKKGDNVIITAGKDRGLVGEVLAVDTAKSRVKVHRGNMVVKHQRPNPLTGQEGARIEKEGWIHVSNVSLYSEKLEGPVRTQARFVGQGGELFADRKAAAESFGSDAPARIAKVRFSPKTEEVFDEIAG
jgi:large subunit ribosomal protein L24